MFRVGFVFTAILAVGFALYAALRDYPLATLAGAGLLVLAWWLVNRARSLPKKRELR